MTPREFLLSLSLWLKLLAVLFTGCGAPVQQHAVNVRFEDTHEAVKETPANFNAPATVKAAAPVFSTHTCQCDPCECKACDCDKEPSPADPTIAIGGPAEATAGELVELTAQGESKGWSWGGSHDNELLVAGHDYRNYEGGSVLTFSTPKPGVYLFVLAGWQEKSVIAWHTLTVRGSGPVPPSPPGPNPPDPPGPLPLPVSLEKVVRDLTLKVNRPAEAAKLAAVYDNVAWKINHGLSDPAAIIELTKTESRKALGANASFWSAWAASLGAELNARSANGVIDHASAWRDIAAGLLATLPQGVKK